MLAQLIVDFSRMDGWFHLQAGPWDVPRGPLGVLFFLPFVPLFWWLPQGRVGPAIILTSLLVSYATLGPAFVALIVGLITFYLVITVAADRARQGADVSPRFIAVTVLVLHLPYVALLFVPSPYFLPPMGGEIVHLTNYLHWCGLAYLHLKAVLVAVDRLQERISPVRVIDYLAFMLFPPTFRMGPLYRFDHFVTQLGDSRRSVDLRKGLVRIAAGFVRLAVMLFLTRQIRWPAMYDEPHSISYYKLLLSGALKPLELYFWIAGYCDIAVGLGRLMGFRVPEQFNGPWFANNIAEFWKRWHITLGRWLYDYPFRAMVAVRMPRSACFVGAFLYVGLWHGFFWSYVAWGLSQGAGLAFYHTWHRWWTRKKKANGPVVRFLRRIRCCDGPVGWWSSWLLNVGYQLVTISIASDLVHAGRWFLPALFGF